MLSNIELRTNLFYIALFAAFLTSACASIEKYKGSDHLPVSNIKQIEGEYQNLPDSIPNQYFSLYNIVTWKESKPDTNKYEWVVLKVIDDKHLEFSFRGFGGNPKVVLTRFMLRKNGLIFLKNAYFHLNGLPYIFGDYQVKRTRIGQTKEGALLVNGTIINEGAVLFILPAGFPKHNFSYKFKRR